MLLFGICVFVVAIAGAFLLPVRGNKDGHQNNVNEVDASVVPKVVDIDADISDVLDLLDDVGYIDEAHCSEF